jgi:uncharacterized peroxidase-related enzyme
MSREKLVSLEAVNPETATGRAKELFDEAKSTVGFVPNMYANMANNTALLDTYFHGYGKFREGSGLSSQEQEVIFLAISSTNNCEYCMGAHSMIADKMSGVTADVLQAIRAGKEIPDAKLAALDAFTREMVTSRGNPDKDAIAAFHAAGYEDKDMLAIILAISVKVISNYSNHLFASQLDDAFAAYSWPE